MTGRRVFVIFALVVCSTAPIWSQRGDDVALRAAIETETLRGDVQAAIEQYRKLSTSTSRSVAAEALLRLAGCYEKLGRPEATATYTKVIRDFSDQPRIASLARDRLVGTSQSVQGPTVQMLKSSRDDRVYGEKVSSDGRYIAYLDRRWVFILDLLTGGEKLVAAPTSPTSSLDRPLISPDGKFVVFRETFGATTAGAQEKHVRLEIVGVDGSGRRTFAAAVGNPEDWSPDSRKILVRLPGQPSRYQLIAIADGTATNVPVPAGLEFPKFSPDGQYLAFSGRREGQGIVSLRLSDSSIAVLVEESGSVVGWSSRGDRVLFMRDMRGNQPGELWAIAVSDGKPQGAAAFVRRGVPRILGVTNDDGYVYRAPNQSRKLYVVDIDPSTARTTGRPRELAVNGDTLDPMFSPDGQSLAFCSSVQAVLPVCTIVVRDLANKRDRSFGGPVAASTPMSAQGRLVGWLPDSRKLIYHTNDRHLHLLDTETGETTPIIPTIQVSPAIRNLQWRALSPDGKSMLQMVTGGAAPSVINRLDLETGTSKQLLRIDARLNGFSLSPDGKAIALAVVDGEGLGQRTTSIRIAAMSGGDSRVVHRAEGVAFRDVVWAPNGERLYFTSSINSFEGPRREEVGADIWTVRADGTDARALKIGLNDQYHLSIRPDGRQLVFMDENYRNELWMLRGLFPNPR